MDLNNQFGISEANYVVMPAYRDVRGRYILPHHVGKKMSQGKAGLVANSMLVYDVREKKIHYVGAEYDEIRNADMPGVTLYNHLIKNYKNAILITSKTLRLSGSEKNLEKIINETAEGAGTRDAKQALKEYIREKFGEEYLADFEDDSDPDAEETEDAESSET